MLQKFGSHLPACQPNSPQHSHKKGGFRTRSLGWPYALKWAGIPGLHTSKLLWKEKIELQKSVVWASLWLVNSHNVSGKLQRSSLMQRADDKEPYDLLQCSLWQGHKKLKGSELESSLVEATFCWKAQQLVPITTALFRRVSSATWFNTHKSKEGQSCFLPVEWFILHPNASHNHLCLNPNTDLPCFCRVSSNSICSVFARFCWLMVVQTACQEASSERPYMPQFREQEPRWNLVGARVPKNLFMSEAVKFLQARVEIQYKKSNCFSTAPMVVKELFCSMMPPFYKEGFISSCEFWETFLTLVKFANI